MAVTFPFERVRHYLIPAVAGLIGLGVAVGIATVPSDVLNAAVDRGGFSSILPAAASPIGATGRTLIALVAGALIAACGFLPQLKAMLVARLDSFARAPRGEQDDAPVVRRADAHPDAPPRRPIRAASDLGDPLPIFGEEDRRSAPLPPPVVQSLPDDLDRPLADFDPAAVPLRPMAPPEPVAPLMRAPEAPVVEAQAPRFVWLASDEPEDAAKVTDPTPDSLVEVASTPVAADCSSEPVARETRVDPQPIVVSEPASSVPQSARARSTIVAPKAATSYPVTLQATPATDNVTPHATPATDNVTLQEAPTTDDQSIAGLLARLERGAAQRRIVAPVVVAPTPPPPPTGPASQIGSAPQAGPATLDETLQRLRRLAAG